MAVVMVASRMEFCVEEIETSDRNNSKMPQRYNGISNMAKHGRYLNKHNVLQELQKKKKWRLDDAAELYDAYIKYGRDLIGDILKLELIIESEDKFKEFATNELHLSCDEVEYTVDRLADGQRQNIESLFLQYGICKEIYLLRLDYWKKGRRLETSFKMTANESIQNFVTMQKGE
ncbi:hypothetical protein RFI_35610 [Reticulomyxa filosa]|uniref:Uncharacterized protein n=1 Tax=Reticulomyxa filosa TaxID=46433 RepID=X6LJP5_RETFI|nr:hypothetical protein RFI_35610 [Reticulomyxa filosa]|eukprot:ETO01829.1 hypothetical protein RFI_35610 [Reticulomyxa filosa]